MEKVVALQRCQRKIQATNCNPYKENAIYEEVSFFFDKYNFLS